MPLLCCLFSVDSERRKEAGTFEYNKSLYSVMEIKATFPVTGNVSNYCVYGYNANVTDISM